MTKSDHNSEVSVKDQLKKFALKSLYGFQTVIVYGLGTRDANLLSLFSIYIIVPERIISLSIFLYAIIWFFPSIIGAGITVVESKKLPKKSPAC